MRGSDTCELLFQGCEVPHDNVLGQVDKVGLCRHVCTSVCVCVCGGGAFFLGVKGRHNSRPGHCRACTC